MGRDRDREHYDEGSLAQKKAEQAAREHSQERASHDAMRRGMEKAGKIPTCGKRSPKQKSEDDLLGGPMSASSTFKVDEDDLDFLNFGGPQAAPEEPHVPQGPAPELTANAGVGELKAYLRYYGEDFKGITEKAELRALADKVAAAVQKGQHKARVSQPQKQASAKATQPKSHASVPTGAPVLYCDEATFQRWVAFQNIRSLLCHLQLVLWTNAGWSTISISSLVGQEQIKATYRKAIKICHPDKLRSSSCGSHIETHAARVFSTLKQAYSQWETHEKNIGGLWTAADEMANR